MRHRKKDNGYEITVKSRTDQEHLRESLSFAHTLLVSKRNDMIQQGRMNLTMRENKILTYILSHVLPGDPPDKAYVFNSLEFAIGIGLKGKSRYNYKSITSDLKKLSDKSWWLVNGNEKILVRWFHKVHVKEDLLSPGVYKVTFHEDTAPYIHHLREQKAENPGVYYTSYPYQYVIPMKNKYSQRMYEILKSYQINNKEWYFDLNALKALLTIPDENGNPKMPKTWTNWSEFERAVLIPTKREINRYTDIKVDYVAKRHDVTGLPTRKYATIFYFLAGKTDFEKYQTANLIAGTLADSNAEYEQMTLNLYPDPDGSRYSKKKHAFYEERSQAQLEDNEWQLREHIARSSYKMLSESFPEFNEEELFYLTSAAFLHMKPGEVSIHNKELWADIYIGHYYTMIMATKDRTRTSIYNRLLHAVRQDYDDYASQIGSMNDPDVVATG